MAHRILSNILKLGLENGNGSSPSNGSLLTDGINQSLSTTEVESYELEGAEHSNPSNMSVLTVHMICDDRDDNDVRVQAFAESDVSHEHE